MRICLISPELAPFAKTGGLGDVAAALASRLFRRHHDLRVFLPLYSAIDREHYGLVPVEFMQNLELDTGSFGLRYSIFTGQQADGLWIYFIDCPLLYARPGIYSNDGDEHLRFILLSRAALESCQRMGWSPDIIQCNDWQTSLVPLYLKTMYRWDSLFSNTKSVLSIHNIGYQGVFDTHVLQSTGLAGFHEMFHQEDMAHYQINFLKTGVLHADALTTVSPTYANEICTPAYGMGLDGLLSERRDSLFGILNGVDYDIWNPETDGLIPHTYSINKQAGKRRNKAALQRYFNLDEDSEIPLVGIVSRLVTQKGFALGYRLLPQLIRDDKMQLVVLGNGEHEYEEFFAWLAYHHPNQVGFWRGFNNPLSHLIEAGSDIFMMPSLYEPCGLNQMYSLRYGTIPVVRKTGGLADSVIAHTEPNGNGILFEHADEQGLSWAMNTALELYNDVQGWSRLMRNGMKQNFSWTQQAGVYEQLFDALLKS